MNMIPYFEFDEFTAGPLTIHVWGLFAALGFLAGTIVAAKRARALGIAPDHVWNAVWEVILASIIGSRLFEVLFYDPWYYWQHPASVFALWDGGLSSTGGIIGGSLALLWYIRRHHLDWWRTLDAFAFAAPLGLLFGRIGCFFIKDHPGRLTDFFLGVRYPDGVRHDGGLEMAIADGFIFLAMLIVARVSSLRGTEEQSHRLRRDLASAKQSTIPPGSFVLLFLALKGFARFWLDFYRATDIIGAETRYVGLTPSQYAGIIAVLVAVAIVFVKRKKRDRTRKGRIVA